MTRTAMRRRLAAVLPVAAIVAVLVALFLAADGAADRPPIAAVRAIVAIPDALAVASRPAQPPRRPVAPDAAMAEVQVCGGAWVAADAQGVPEEGPYNALLERLSAETAATALAGLQASPDLRDVATGLHLRTVLGRSRSQGTEMLNEDGRAAWEALVDMALVGRDPEIYGMARQACGRASPSDGDTPAAPARCALLDAAQWAALDPRSAAPWLARADEARRANDRPGEDEALWHASRADRFDSGYGRPIARVFGHVPDDDANALGSFALAGAAIGLSGVGIGGAAATSCSAAALADSHRHTVCRALAEALVSKGDTSMDHKLGIAIGRRAGWPEDRLAAIEAEASDLRTAFDGPEIVDSVADCKGMRRGNDRIRDIGRHGELGSLRRALAARTAASAPVLLR